MKISLKKNAYSLDIFFVILFLLLMLLRFNKLSIFGVSIESNIPLPLSILSIFYLKKIFLLILAGSFKAVFLLGIIIILLIISLFVIYKVAYHISVPINNLGLKKSSFIRYSDKLFEYFSKIKNLYILAFLFLISLILRLLLLNDGLFHHDSVQLAIAVEETVKTGKLHAIAGYKYGFVLVNVVGYSIAHFIFGADNAEFSVKLNTVLFASLAVVMLYMFIKEIFNSYIGFSSALMFSVTPIFFSITTYALSHAHSIFFILSSGYFLIKAIKTDKLSYKLFFGIFMGFSLFIRFPETMLSLILFALIYSFQQKIFNQKNIKMQNKFSVSNSFSFLIPFVALLVLNLIFQSSSIIHQAIANKFLEFPPLALTIIYGLIRSSTNFGFFLALFGVIYSYKKNRYITSLFLIWFFIVLIFFLSFISSAFRFFVLCLIVLILFISMKLDSIKEKYGLLSPTLLAFIVILMFVSTYPIVSFRHEYSSLKELSKFVSGKAEEGDLIIDYGDFAPFYDYYGKRKIMPCPLVEKPEEINGSMQVIKSVIQRNNSVYIVSSCFSFGTEEQKINLLSAIKTEYKLTEVGEKLYDDFYRSEIDLALKNFKIYKLQKK